MLHYAGQILFCIAYQSRPRWCVTTLLMVEVWAWSSQSDCTYGYSSSWLADTFFCLHSWSVQSILSSWKGVEGREGRSERERGRGRGRKRRREATVLLICHHGLWRLSRLDLWLETWRWAGHWTGSVIISLPRLPEDDEKNSATYNYNRVCSLGKHPPPIKTSFCHEAWGLIVHRIKIRVFPLSIYMRNFFNLVLFWFFGHINFQ